MFVVLHILWAAISLGLFRTVRGEIAVWPVLLGGWLFLPPAGYAAAGDPAGLFTFAGVRWAGVGGAPDPRLARALYARAEEAGQPMARHLHTNLIASGIAGRRDWPRALGRLREEARSDPARRRAADLIDRMQLTGDGDPAAMR